MADGGVKADQYKDASLDTLGNGAAHELFEREMERIAANMLDPETDPTAKRSIVLKVAFSPTDDRRSAQIEITGKSTVAPARGVSSTVWLGRRRGEAVAVTQNLEQGDVFEDDADDGDVVEFPAAEERSS